MNSHERNQDSETARKNKKVIKNVLRTVATIGLSAIATASVIASVQKDRIIEDQKITIEEREEEIKYLNTEKDKITEKKINDGEYKELKNEEGKNVCSVCLLGKVTKVLIPCGHYAVCSSCITKIKAYNDSRCPICRRKFEKAVTVYVN